MRVLIVILCSVFVVACSSKLQQQTSFVWPEYQTEFKWPEAPSSNVFKALLEAYNQNDMAAIQAFVNKYYPANKAKSKDIYWRQIFSEYGKLKPFAVDKHMFHGLPVIWLQGELTKSWLKMVIMSNDEGTQIKRVGVFRKMRPTIGLPPYQSMSLQQMPSYLNHYLSELAIDDRFSGSVLVAKGDKIIFQQGVGFNNKSAQITNLPTSIFPIASTTKMFTAVAIAQLWETGKLALADPISKFLPEYPKDIAEQVTVKHLLTHTSGIEYDDHDPFYYENLVASNIEEMVKLQIKYQAHMNQGRSTNFQVLNKFDYTNDGYVLLGAIIEKVSGYSYGEYIEKFIFEPARMNHSIAINDKFNALSIKPKKYSFNDQDMRFQLGPRKEVSGSAVSSIIMPAGGIYSSVNDLFQFFQAFNQGRLVSLETKAEMAAEHATQLSSEPAQHHIQYGYGVMTRTTGQAVSFGHGGADLGVGSSFEYFPEQDLYVIVLSNYGAVAANLVAEHIRDLIEPNMSKRDL